MKGIIFDGKRAVFRNDLPIPEPEAGHVRIRVLRANVCSTDREVLKGYRPDFRGIMGHEFVGVIDRVAGPSESDPECLDANGHDLRQITGALVVGELNEGCGHCIYCRSGREKHCMNRKVIGMSRDGCFAEYLTLADHLVHEVPEGLAPEVAVYTEPLAAALEITSRVHIDPARNVAVIGDGRLSYMIAQVLSLSGADLTVIGKHREKLMRFDPFARTRTIDSFGLHLDSGNPSLAGGFEPSPEKLDEDTYEIVVDATGNPSGLDLASRITRRQGTIIVKSTYAGATRIDMSRIVVNEITIQGSRCGPFEPALNLLSRGLVKLPEVEWHRLDEYEAAFSSRAFKAGFRVGSSADTE